MASSLTSRSEQRIGKLADPIELAEGDEIDLTPGTADDVSTKQLFTVDYATLLSDLQTGDRLAIGDGSIVLQIIGYGNDAPSQGALRRTDPGPPRAAHPIRPPQDHDPHRRRPAPARRLRRGRHRHGCSLFVRSAHDVRRVSASNRRRAPLSSPRSKLAVAVENLDGIITASGAVMVARGDLA
ncbi:MAG: pyruvate kinase [Acidimicrobiales bacterium]